jgi:hypothetical protein
MLILDLVLVRKSQLGELGVGLGARLRAMRT